MVGRGEEGGDGGSGETNDCLIDLRSVWEDAERRWIE